MAAAATFSAMKDRADELVPDVANRIWRSNTDFSHRGANGQWRDVLDDATVADYEARAAAMMAPDAAAWAHGGRHARPVAQPIGATEGG